MASSAAKEGTGASSLDASARRRAWRGRVRSSRSARTIGACLALALAYLIVSYVRALLQPNSPGFRLRSAEWLRDHHAGCVLDVAEWCWYSLRKSRLEALESFGVSAFPPPYRHRLSLKWRRRPAPAPIAVLFDTPLTDEGIWRDAGWTVDRLAALRCTSFRPDLNHPKVVVGVARFTPELTRFVLVPGGQDPAGEWSWHGAIPDEQRVALLAAFNSGFRMSEARGGFYAERKIAKPLVAGAASLVIDQNGAADIVSWQANRPLTPDVVAVRQNLRLIVDGGEVVPGLSRNLGGAWGFTLNQGYYTWRSGLGIARDGALIYVAGDGLTLVTLAIALQHAGALRAMELDIHDYWSSFNVYQPMPNRGAGIRATKLLPSMPRPAERYLTPDDRDFVAVFVR